MSKDKKSFFDKNANKKQEKNINENQHQQHQQHQHQNHEQHEHQQTHQEEFVDQEFEQEAVEQQIDENDLVNKYNALQEELNAKNQKILMLEKQVEALNNSFKTELIKKANEAQAKLQEKVKEYQTKFETELKNAKKFALRDKAVDLINIINNFDNAVNMPNKNPEIQNYVKGFMMFSNMFKNYLENNNITEIKVNVNDEFNAQTMEAFDAEQNPNFKPNHVIKVIKKGYKLHDVVIIPALVLVSK